MSSHDVLPVVWHSLSLTNLNWMNPVFRHVPCETTVRRRPACCASEGNGRSKKNEGENEGDQEFHSDTSLSVYWGLAECHGQGRAGNFRSSISASRVRLTHKIVHARVPLKRSTGRRS